MDLEAGRWFVAVVEGGSIAAAARTLDVSRPTLSRRLAAFEDELGIALLHRTAREVRPTAAGRRLVDGLRPLLTSADRLAASFAREREVVSGTLKVSCAPALAVEVAQILVVLQERHPELAVDLRSSPVRVDLRDGTFDIALRAGRLTDPDLVQRWLLRRSVGAWASPGYLEANGVPTSPGDLAGHRLLRSLAPDGRARPSWPLVDGGRVAVEGTFVSDDQVALREAAVNGAGIALLDARTAAGTSALVRVLEGQIGTELDLHAVFARRTLQPARVRAFLEAAVAAFTGPSV